MQSFDPEVERIFLAYDWPGNVRHLQNMIQSVFVLYNGYLVTRVMFPPPLNRVHIDPPGRAAHSATRVGARPSVTPTDQSVIRPLRDIKRDVIKQAISFYDDNIPRAAAAQGVRPSTMYRNCQTWVAARA